MFKVRAYQSRAAGESGRVTPAYSSATEDYKTAQHIAAELSKEYGSCVIENSESGNRTWIERKA